MAGAAVIWRSTKQKIIALSSTEAEYVALTSAMQEMLYVQNMLRELNFDCNEFVIYADNTSTIKITQSNAYSDRTSYQVQFSVFL